MFAATLVWTVASPSQAKSVGLLRIVKDRRVKAKIHRSFAATTKNVSAESLSRGTVVAYATCGDQSRPYRSVTGGRHWSKFASIKMELWSHNELASLLRMRLVSEHCRGIK